MHADHPMKPIQTAVLLVSLLLGACAQLPEKAAAPSEPLLKVVSPAATSHAVPLPRVELSEELLFKLTLAEIAAQRDQLHVAVPALLEVARETGDPRVAQRATEVAWKARFLPAALEAATHWLKADPQSMRARQSVVALLINQSRLDDAVPHLEKWLESNPAQVGQNFLRLSALVAAHQDKQVILRVLKALAVQYPEVPEANLAVAQAAANARDYPTALEASRQALRQRPGWEPAALFRARELWRDSNAKAIAFLKGFLDQYPGAKDVRLNYARLLVNSRQYPEARRQFGILLGEAPNNAEITLAVATLFMQAKDYVAAETQFRRTLDIKPKNPDAVRIYLGQVNEELKRPEEALKWYSSVTHGEQFVAARARYAGVLAKQGKLADAREYLRSVNASNADQRNQLTLAEANLLREANAYREAFEFLGKAVASTPDTPDLLYDYAMAAERINRIDVLESNLRRVIAIRPDHAHAYNALGYSLADRNQRLPEALTLIETAHKLAPEDPFILDSLGWVMHRLGKNEDALGHLKRAYELRPEAEIAAHLGEVLWVLGHQDEAGKLWAESLREHPKNEVLQNTVKRLAPAILQSSQ